MRLTTGLRRTAACAVSVAALSLVGLPGTAQAVVVAGDDDPSVPVLNARMLAARLPDARLHVIKGGGHLFLLDEPESVARPIRAFLDAA